jgi:photosystem II stability/assembly factor-like uncharacterized protein
MANLLIGTEPVTALADGWAIRSRRVLVDDSGDEQISFADKLTALTAAPRGVFVGTSTGELLRYDGSIHPVPGFDQVPGRDEWHAVGSSKPYVRSMSTSADGGVIFANVHVGGIPRSTDGGETWEPTIDVDSDVHQVLAHPERPELVVAAAAVGLAISRDAGASWTVRTKGLHGSYARAVAVSGDTVFLSASTGPFTHEGALYRGSLADDAPLERVTDWLDGNVDSGRLAASGDNVAFGDPDGRLYVSDDGGQTWAVRDDVSAVTALAYSRA